MKCRYSEQDWLNYVHDHKNETNQREMEQHLTFCSTCMIKYEKALTASFQYLERTYGSAPDLSESILSVLAHTVQNDHPHKQKQIRLTNSALIHYGIAASLALLLYRVGIFDHIFLYADQSQIVAEQPNEWFNLAKTSTMQWFSKLSNILNKSF